MHSACFNSWSRQTHRIRINELQLRESYTMTARSQWSSGLCEPSCKCFCACFLPCVVFAQNVDLMETNKISPIPVVDQCTPPPPTCSKPLCGGVLYGVGTLGVYLNACVPLDGPLFSLAQCLSIYVHMQVRGKIRSHYNIEPECCGSSSDCDDFCCAMWCYSCALTQENRMLEKNTPNVTVVEYPALLTLPNTMSG